MFFFFKAEDGIGYSSVTGVQTCALPISSAKPAERLSFILLIKVNRSAGLALGIEAALAIENDVIRLSWNGRLVHVISANGWPSIRAKALSRDTSSLPCDENRPAPRQGSGPSLWKPPHPIPLPRI